MEIFNFELEHKIRVVKIKDEVWFVGSDIAKALGYKNAPDAISRHCKSKGITRRYPIQTSGGVQGLIIINEPNMYRLVINCKLSCSERFEDWVFSVVLPSIRTKGSYDIKDNSFDLSTIQRIERKSKNISLYLIKDRYSKYTKIGVTSNIEQRIKTLSVGNPNLELLWLKDSTTQEERMLHKLFSEKRIGGEWFNLDAKDIEQIKIIVTSLRDEEHLSLQKTSIKENAECISV